MINFGQLAFLRHNFLRWASGSLRTRWQGMAARCLAVGLLGAGAGANGAVESYKLIRWAGAEHANVDGPVATARFDGPMGLAMDREDNLYVADSRNRTVRRISSAGLVTTLAGKPGVRGVQDGLGVGARFDTPAMLATDPQGNVYVASYEGRTVQSITPNGWVETVVPSTELELSVLSTIAVDSAQNLYLGLKARSGLRKRSPDGKTVTLAPVSSGENSAYLQFLQPWALAVLVDDSIYASDFYRLLKFSPSGSMTVVSTSLYLDWPRGMTVDGGGNCYITESASYKVSKLTPAGAMSTVAGRYQRGHVDATGTAALFDEPYGIARDRVGNLFVSEHTLSLIRRITPEGVVTTYAGKPVRSEDGEGTVALFGAPYDLAADPAGNLYVSDAGNGTVRKVDTQRRVSTLAGRPGERGTTDGVGNEARFSSLHGIAVDGGGNIYVADPAAFTIRKITPGDVMTTLAGTAFSAGSVDGVGAAARFSLPRRLTVDRDGNVFVADGYAIRKITPDGTVTRVAGDPLKAAYVDAQGADARFLDLTGLAADGSGNLYVAEHGLVRKVSSAGVVTTVAGDKDDWYSTLDGQGAAARFRYISALTISRAGEIYVLTEGAIRKVTPNGTVSTVATIELTGGLLGLGITTDGAGTIYVADYSSRTIRKLALVSPAPTIEQQPQSRVVAVDGKATMTMASSGGTVQWRRNGDALAGATGLVLTINQLQPGGTGLVDAVVANETTEAITAVAILGLSSGLKVTDAGEEVGSDIYVAKNGNTFDQVLLTGAAGAIRADYDPDPAKNQITRTSFVDLDDDIVQVEFSGPGTLSLVLDGATAPAAPVNYNQDTTYMKGHAGIVIAGATEQTNVSVFSVGKVTAVNQALFKDGVKYDGIADLAFIAILSSNGKFGGVRTANANYFAAKGLTGLYAPGVAFQGPVFVGNITAFDTATPVIQVGAVTDARITGGDLAQANGAAVQVSGLTQLKFTAGGDSHGNALPAQKNKAVLTQDGVDVTAQIVVNP